MKWLQQVNLCIKLQTFYFNFTGLYYGDQLAKVKINQKADVMIDTGNDSVKHFNGTVEWIVTKQFTQKLFKPETERANLVYAVRSEY